MAVRVKKAAAERKEEKIALLTNTKSKHNNLLGKRKFCNLLSAGGKSSANRTGRSGARSVSRRVRERGKWLWNSFVFLQRLLIEEDFAICDDKGFEI